MNYTEIRKLLLKVFIGFLSVTALVAIYSVLGHEFGKTQLKILATTFSISAGSICAMSCAAFIERKGAKEGGGIAGIMAIGLAVLLVNIGMWGEIKDASFWKTTATLIVISIAIAHACLLRLPRLAAIYRWTQTTSTVLIGLLAAQIIFAVWAEVGDELYMRLIAAVSVLILLGTLVVPICSRLGDKAAAGPADNGQGAERAGSFQERLMLQKVSGDLFVDRHGRLYQVTEIRQ